MNILFVYAAVDVSVISTITIHIVSHYVGCVKWKATVSNVGINGGWWSLEAKRLDVLMWKLGFWGKGFWENKR